MRKNSDQKILKLHVVGVDERSRNALKLFFKHNCNNAFCLIDEVLADVFLVDMDGYGAEDRYQDICKRYPKRPIILMSLSANKAEGHQFLRKPISINQLRAVLSEIGLYQTAVVKKTSQQQPDRPQQAIKISHRSPGYAANLLSESELHSFVGKAKDIDILNPRQLSSIYFSPADYLLGKLQQACSEAIEQQRVTQVVGLWKPITIFPLTGKVHVELSDRQLQAICVVSVHGKGGVVNIDDVEIKTIKSADNFTPPNQGEYHDIEPFLWKVALWTARGRLPEGIVIEKPIYLRAWPNFTRLVVTPHALRISACLIKHPRSLIDIAATLHIPQRYVFAFFTAANQAGLAGQARRTSDLIVEPPKVQKSAKSGLLSRILERLSRSIGANSSL